MSKSKVPVVLSHRAPGIQPPLYVAGSFSDPEWVPALMDYTTGEDGVHTFTKTIEVEPRSRVAYKYRVGEGDWWILNENAPTTTDDAGNQNNSLEAPDAPISPESEEEPKAEAFGQHYTSDSHAGDSNTNNKEYGAAASEAPAAATSSQAERLAPAVQALKLPEHIDRWQTRTPEVAAEVADSAALLDLPPTNSQAPDDIQHESPTEAPSAVADIAEKAAEADIAAEVADTAEMLDGNEANTQPSAETPASATKQDPAEVAAEVADTAQALDGDEPSIHLEAPSSSAYRNLADVKADMKDDSLDIAGFSNDPEPVPLFAHECAGLYEDDEIPGAAGIDESRENKSLSQEPNEDFDDPTLERFPSNREEIVSTVRKVGTGLNADQTLVEGVPPSPLFKERQSSSGDASGEKSEPNSPTSPRGQHNLDIPAPLPQRSTKERSMSATSLHSIAESAEEEETTDSKPETLASQGKVSSNANEETSSNPQVSAVSGTGALAEESSSGKNVQSSKADDIAPLAEKAETADEVISAAKKAEGEAKLPSQKPVLASLITVPSHAADASTGLLSPVSDEDEAIGLKNGKTKGADTTQSGYLTPERAATPKPEEPGSPREPPPNAADPIPTSEYGIQEDENKLEVQPAVSEPRSPTIVVSKAEETHADEDLLSGSPAHETHGKGNSTDHGTSSNGSSSRINENGKREAAVDTVNPLHEEAQDVKSADAGGAANGVDTTDEAEGDSHGSSVRDSSSHAETAATSSAVEDSQTGSLKKRSVARPNPTDRAATPNSITGPHREAAKGGNWFSAFFRLIFVDLVGGFVRRLCGGKRKKLVTTVVVLSAVGIAAFWRSSTVGA